MLESYCCLSDAKYRVCWDRPHDLAIGVDPDGLQPSYLLESTVQRRTLVAGSFVGDIHRGGSCNVDVFELTPHCHGTHTETVSHIADPLVPVRTACPLAPLIAHLITVTPCSPQSTHERYEPALQPADQVISAVQLREQMAAIPGKDRTALIVRTVPNPAEKQGWKYSYSFAPPFFTNEAMQTIVDAGVQHLLVDLPSIDRIDDDGRLSNHRIFWQVAAGSRTWTNAVAAKRTISEMLYIPDSIADGLYALLIGAPAWQTDAAPSRPCLFDLEPA